MKALLIALSTLTPFPSSPEKWTEKELRLSVVFYPLVGGLIGGLLALTAKIHLTHDLKAPLLLLLWVLATAVFHLDGLSDCLDGFFGGKTPEERRRIMKDPSIGAFGVTGIVLTLLFKYALLSRLLAGEENWKWFLIIPMAARWAVTFSCAIFKAPQGDRGLGSQVVGLPAPLLAASTVLALAIGIALLKFPALEAYLLAATMALMVGFLSKSRIGGLTGDGMGATVELTEVGLLFFSCLSVSKGLLPF